jgi:polyisoprenoid-binding protein YceI
LTCKKRSSILKTDKGIMKQPILTFFILISSIGLFAQTYTPADNGSKVHFVIKNFGIATGGDFTGLSGSITFDPANLAASQFDVSVDAKSIDTDIEARDHDLRKAAYLDVANYPKLTLKSTKITKTNKDGYYYLFGDLTIKGVTKEVKFPFTATAKDGGYLFEGSFKLNRRDFGVGGSSLSLGDDLTVSLSVLAK